MKSARLELTLLNLTHAPLILRLFNDPDFLRYVGDKGIRTLAQAEQYLAEGAMAEYRRSGIANYAVSHRETGVLLGLCGLLQRAYLPGPDLGYGFLPEARNHGFAREAVDTLLHQEPSAQRTLWALVNPNNNPSVRLLLEFGFTDNTDASVVCALPETRLLTRAHTRAHTQR